MATTYSETWLFPAPFSSTGLMGYGETWGFFEPYNSPAGPVYGDPANIDNFHPYPSLVGVYASFYTNKVWDAVAGTWVSWVTNFEDKDGRLYPGPGVFGIDTSDYRVESIDFSAVP